jgi:addiction module RelE/StbE family toxin
MHIEATETFKKLYKKLDLKVKEQIKKSLILLQENPNHPSLHNKKMAGQENIYEIRVTKKYRITYSIIDNTIYLRKVGSHNILNKP